MSKKPLIAILIPTISKRSVMLKQLLLEFDNQLTLLNKEYFGSERITETITKYIYTDVEILCDSSPPPFKIGRKRNNLVYYCSAKYSAHFDDDDFPSADYFSELFKAITKKKNVDCCSLRGEITFDGVNPAIFEHSIKYKQYKTNDFSGIKYERYPNHLNLIKTAIVKKISFPHINHGEDSSFATKLYASGLIKTEAYIDKTIYFYRSQTIK